jgi:hypothetical protein
MAPPRKKKRIPGKLYDFKIRFPEDVRERIEKKAQAKGWPQNRVIINELADYPRLEKIGELADHVGHMRDVLARYSSRIVMQDLADELLKAVDTVLATEGGEQQAAIEKLRVERNAMLKTKP